MKNDNSDKLAYELNPNQDLSDKSNYKLFVLIDREGKQKIKVRLSISNIEIREHIIFFNFLSRYVKFFVKETVGVNIVSRDNPWDFEVSLSNNKKIIAEITSIAENEDFFRKMKYEEKMSELSNYPEIELYKLEKLNFNFPNEKVSEIIQTSKKNGISKNGLIKNPLYENNTFIFLSNYLKNEIELEELIKESINKKLNKKHKDKEEVYLIIDNRTVTYELQEIYNMQYKLYDYFNELPFKEIWLYTGYYSDVTGNKTEFSLAPLKISDSKIEILIKEIEK